jgi:hypothetical protein
MLKNRFLFLITFIVLALTGCAKRGTVTGGPLDTIPPLIVRSSPDNMSTNFSGREIRMDFSEYIKVKDINKQLIISPPMETAPDIVPMGSASKFISIKIKDTLQPNTTYSFNFGESITDNNEGNPYSQFKFVFSTGSYIDSLKLNGSIKDAYTKETDDFVTVMLYEANEAFNDSTIYKQKPRYVTNTLDSVTDYSLENLKEGKYYLFAMKDKGNNYKYDPKSDKIAFLNKPVTIPTDTVYSLKLFEEQSKFRAVKPTLISSNRLAMGYEGDARGINVSVKNPAGDKINTITTQFPEKDSVQIWMPRDIKADSLQVSVNRKEFSRDFWLKMKEMKAMDSLAVTAVQKGDINFRDKFAITSSTPLLTVDTAKMTLVNKDSTAVAFTTAYNDFEQKLEFDFKKEEDQKYTFTLLPGALVDFYGKENDTLTYNLSTRLLMAKAT